MIRLLDANVLIALTVQEHEHHERATRWAAGVDELAICPVVEGALIRFLLRLGESAATASEVVQKLRVLPACDFWADSLSYADVDLGQVTGHRQVTDAYLVSLAHSHGGLVATLDEGLVATAPESTLLVPHLDT